jgi:sugar O-acyltransferase (sialic acid O-acetyltransferase NeuD family)
MQLVGFGGVYAQEISQSLLRLGQPHHEIHTNQPFGSENYTWQQPIDPKQPVLLSHIDPVERIALAELLKDEKELEFATVIDPSSVVSSNTSIGHGSHVGALVAIGANVSIGCHVFINRSASIAHDCVVESFVSTGPGAILCGSVKLGFGSFIGAGAVIKDGITVGRHAYVGAGAVVVKNVSDFEVVVGNPARNLRTEKAKSELECCPWCLK